MPLTGSKVTVVSAGAALLDVCFRNDARAFVALGLGSEKDAAAIYNSILDSEMDSLDLTILGTKCPNSLKNENLLTFRADYLIIH